jgi:hypothetical protein
MLALKAQPMNITRAKKMLRARHQALTPVGALGLASGDVVSSLIPEVCLN